MVLGEFSMLIAYKIKIIYINVKSKAKIKTQWEFGGKNIIQISNVFYQELEE